MRRAYKAVVLVAVLWCASAVLAAAAEYKIVGHPGTTPDSISKRDLSRIFLKQRSSWSSGQTAEPVDLKGESEVRAKFSEEILRRSIEMVESYWQGQVFSGKATPPPSEATERAVVEFVRRTPGAVGYVSPGTDASGVKVIEISQ